MGGPTSHEALSYVRAVAGIEFKGFDVVEVSPPYDNPASITALFAANLIFEITCPSSGSRRRRTPSWR